MRTQKEETHFRSDEPNKLILNLLEEKMRYQINNSKKIPQRMMKNTYTVWCKEREEERYIQKEKIKKDLL